MAEGELNAEGFAAGVAVGSLEGFGEAVAVDWLTLEEEPAAGNLEEAASADVGREGFDVAIVPAALEWVVIDLSKWYIDNHG
jgi:hypothetical protein